MDPTLLRVEQTAFTTVPLVFCLLHLLFFVFDPRRRENLYLSILSACFAGAAFFEYQQDLSPRPPAVVGLVLIFGLVLSTLRLIQERVYERPPRRFWWLVAAAAGATTWLLIDRSAWLWIIGVFTLVALAELAAAFPRMARSGDRAAWVLGVGFLVLAAGGVLDILIDLGLMTSFLGTTNPWLYAAMLLLLAVSIHLAGDFARLNRELERRLAEVERLSEERLRQERAAREQEVAHRLLEAEDARKSEELEQARRLQLAMLPERLPESDVFELAAFTRTATEVGGDYYDAHAHADGALTLALGDAVGHGARAGTLVAVGKGLFHLVAEVEDDLGRALDRFNRALRESRLERASIALLLARLRPGSLQVAAAGVPPPLLARAGGGVEEIAVAGLPLGSSSLGRYTESHVELAAGDTLLFATDGLAETPRDGRSDGEPFGYGRVRTHFAEAARTPAVERIPDRLWAQLRDWTGDPTGDQRPADDVTMLVVRMR